MDFNLFCEEENCISEASAFYFKTFKQRKVCDAHLPSYGEKVYPIEQFYFVQSPEDESLYLRRLDEVRQGKVSLEKMSSLAKDEQTAALALLDKHKARAVQVVNEAYEAEKRRTKQHFHQLEVFITDFIQEFDIYLHKKETRLSSLLEKLTTELSGLSLLRVRTVENDLELARVVMDSCSLGELPFDSHLTALLNPKLRIQVASHLFQLAKKSSETDSYIELQQALANCTESEALNQLPEVTRLKAFLKDRLDNMKTTRERDLLDLVTHDAEAIRSLLDLYSKNISVQKVAGEVLQVESLYGKALSFALPESRSKATLDILLSYVQWRTEQGQEKNPELKKIWKAALKISTPYYHPNPRETMNMSLQLGKLYQKENKYTAALKYCQAAADIGIVEFPKSKDTADAFASLGLICYRTKDKKRSEDCYKAALEILDINFRNSSERAEVYANLGMLYEEMTRFAEAGVNYQISLEILRSHFPASSQLVNTLIQTARFYDTSGNASEAGYFRMEAYALSSEQDFQDLRQKLLDEGYPPTGDVQQSIAVLRGQVKSYDVAAHQWQRRFVLRRNIQVDHSSSSILIAPNCIIACGGGYTEESACTCHVGNSAYMLDGDGNVQELPPMLTGRCWSGLAWDPVRKALYVFAGAAGSEGTCYIESLLSSSEMFQPTESNGWSPLPDMHHRRCYVNPCWYSCLVYLCGGEGSKTVETYNPRSNTFALLDFSVPEKGDSTAVVANGVLTVISFYYISKLQQGKLTTQQHEQYYAWSYCTPIVSKGVVYLVNVEHSCCMEVDTASGAKIKEVSYS